MDPVVPAFVAATVAAVSAVVAARRFGVTCFFLFLPLFGAAVTTGADASAVDAAGAAASDTGAIASADETEFATVSATSVSDTVFLFSGFGIGGFLLGFWSPCFEQSVSRWLYLSS